MNPMIWNKPGNTNFWPFKKLRRVGEQAKAPPPWPHPFLGPTARDFYGLSGLLTSYMKKFCKDYDFLSLWEKNRRSNHLKMRNSRQHPFLLRYFKTLSVGLVRNELMPTYLMSWQIMREISIRVQCISLEF